MFNFNSHMILTIYERRPIAKVTTMVASFALIATILLQITLFQIIKPTCISM